MLLIALLFVLALWFGFQQALVGDELNGRRDVTIMTCLVLVVFGIYFALPRLLVNEKRGHKFSLLLKLVGPITCIILNIVKDGKNATTQYGFLLQLNFDLVFMAQGLTD